MFSQNLTTCCRYTSKMRHLYSLDNRLCSGR